MSLRRSKLRRINDRSASAGFVTIHIGKMNLCQKMIDVADMLEEMSIVGILYKFKRK